VHLVGFIIRIYHDARSPELQMVSMYTVTQLSTNRCNNKFLTLKGHQQVKYVLEKNYVYFVMF